MKYFNADSLHRCDKFSCLQLYGNQDELSMSLASACYVITTDIAILTIIYCSIVGNFYFILGHQPDITATMWYHFLTQYLFVT